MIVAELIERLGEFSPDLPVVLFDGEYGLGFTNFRLAVDRADEHDGVWMTRQEGLREILVIC